MSVGTRSKHELLAEMRAALVSGIVTQADITAVTMAAQQQKDSPRQPEHADKLEKLSAVDAMFYAAGTILFCTIVSIIAQSWNDGSWPTHILLSAGTGVILWSLAYLLTGRAHQTDIRKGLVNALLLTGSLSLIAGGYIITNEIIGGFSDVNFTAFTLTLVVLGGMHLGFDRLLRRDLTLLMGILLCTAAFPALVFGFLQTAEARIDLWAVVLIISAGILAYATRVVAKISPSRQRIRRSFDTFALFLALAVAYLSGFGDYGILWSGALITAVLGIFYLSVVRQNKHLLGSASFFLVLEIITISFKYFSGYGTTTSLVVATIGLLASATLFITVNKKYFQRIKQAAPADSIQKHVG